MQQFFDNFVSFLREIASGIVPAVLFPLFVIFFLILFYVYYIKILLPERGTTEWIKMRRSAADRHLTLLGSRHPLDRTDILPVIIICIVFICFAVFNLGKTTPVDILAEIAEPTQGRTHIDNMYFDEIYFVRTAAEHIEGINPYEWTHPPLGKNIIAASILIFGSSPFGWRILGALCGVLMLFVMYVFLKNMSGKTCVAVCGTLLLGFDFMRLVQSRIGTIDTYAVLFILLAYLFMYRLVTTDPQERFSKSLPSLALSGIFFGLGATVKWVGLYAGAGLLVIYIIRLVMLAVYYAGNNKRGFGLYFLKTVLFSFLFFIIVPAVIYYLNYIPYGLARGMSLSGGMLWSREYFDIVWANQIAMFNYHAYLEATHGGSSSWWQWIFDIKPILYVNSHTGGLRSTYGAFGNPVLYWSGIAAMIAMAVRVFTHRDGKALFILIGYLAQLLPWVAVTRVVFAYHYLPSTLFLVLALGHIFNIMFDRAKHGNREYVYTLTGLTGGTFVMFFPMLAGVYLPDWYYNFFIKWLPGWPF